jgi:predicted ferric reductase
MLRIKNNLGLIALLILSFAPVVFWIAMRPLVSRFVSVGATLTSLGQLSGLVGLAMFAVVLILSGKFKFLEGYFGGLNRVYFAHHFFGGLAFVLMLLHPLFLAGKFLLVSTRSAALFLLPSANVAVNLGIFSLIFLITLLVITFFAKLPYERWKVTHKFLGFAFFLAGLHSFLVPSDISRYLPFRLYILLLAVLGIVAYNYRTILGFILVKKFNYFIKNIRQLDSSVVEIELAPQDESQLKFQAGQFVNVSFQNKFVGNEFHPFSLAGSILDKNLKIVIKNLGDLTAKLKNLKVGESVKIEGPYGRFFTPNDKEEVWLAGGIGITPFLSRARTMSAQGVVNKVINLFYCVKNESEAVFLAELSALSAVNKNFKVFSFCSDAQGYISAEHLKNTIGELDAKEFFLCGPPVMMNSLKNQLLTSGISKHNIHSEEFSF